MIGSLRIFHANPSSAAVGSETCSLGSNSGDKHAANFGSVDYDPLALANCAYICRSVTRCKLGRKIREGCPSAENFLYLIGKL